MARFFQPIQQQVVRMDTPVNVDFYANLLNQAQGNLEKGTAMQAKFLEDAYGQKYLDEATRNAQINKAQELIKNSLESEFVSPSRVGRDVIKASQQLSPWKNLNEKQIEEYKRQQDLQARYGSNYIGNDVSKLSLTDDNGNLINPDRIKNIAGNREDLVQAFMRDNAGLANKVTDIPGQWRTTAGGQLLEQITQKIKGLTEQERAQMFDNNPQVVELYMKQMPALSEAIQASGQNPSEYLSKEISNISKQLVGGTTIERQHAANQDYLNAYQKSQMAGASNSSGRFVNELDDNALASNTIEEFTQLAEALNNPEKATNTLNNIKQSGVRIGKNVGVNIINAIPRAENLITRLITGGKYGFDDWVSSDSPDFYTKEEVQKQGKEKLNQLKSEYAPLYKKLKLEHTDVNGNIDYQKLHNDFIMNAAVLETSVRKVESNKSILAPKEIPLLYSDILNKTDAGDILKDISNGVVSDEGKGYKELISKGKLKPDFQESSVTINPVLGQIELTDVSGKEKYAVDRNRLDTQVKKSLENAQRASTKYLEDIRTGYLYSLPETEQVKYLKEYQDVINYADYKVRTTYGGK